MILRGLNLVSNLVSISGTLFPASLMPSTENIIVRYVISVSLIEV